MIARVLPLLVLCGVALAAPPPNADPALAPWFNSLRRTDGVSCCSISDCRPVKIRIREGQLQAFIDKQKFGQSAPEAWVDVSPDVMLRHEWNPVGEPVACFYGGRVVCFVDASGS